MRKALLLLLLISMVLCIPECLVPIKEYFKNLQEKLKGSIAKHYENIGGKKGISEKYRRYSSSANSYIQDKVSKTKQALDKFKEQKVLPKIEMIKSRMQRKKEEKEQDPTATSEEAPKETQDPEEYIKEIQKFLDQFMEQFHKHEKDLPAEDPNTHHSDHNEHHSEEIQEPSTKPQSEQQTEEIPRVDL
ncbi:hypothetical protein NEFER03_1233 [Nematocida sp. LUAm3]|nr:hypothetical protein NEFER03_1233 [Nematocida sp. LUAm3]